MPSLDQNQELWGQSYHWSAGGDEWSAPWGGPAMQWNGSIRPRIQRFVPTGTILEIACGYGRWTGFLQDECTRLIGVDIAENCIDACRQRFADGTAEFHVNDGTSLAMVESESVDLVFSFDSLVHADPGVLDGYIAQMGRILRPTGAAFIHHSNAGRYKYRRAFERLPKLPAVLRRARLIEYLHLRDFDVTAAVVAGLADRHGLTTISQEITPWLNRRTLVDCFTTIVRADSPDARPNRIVTNRSLLREVEALARLAQLYAP